MPMAIHLQSASWPAELLFVLLVAGAFLVRAQNPGHQFHVCKNESSEKYTIDSIYKANLDSVLGSITSNDSVTTGFFNSSVGQSPNRATAVGLCRGDVSLSDCRTCLNDSSVDIVQRCPMLKEAIIWYDYCMLRYSNRSFLGNLETSMAVYMYSLTDLKSSVDVEEFGRALRVLLEQLRSIATAGNSTFKYAAGNKPGQDFYTIYALSQCSPDLSELDCDRCLGEVRINGLLASGGERLGSRWINPSCNIRYEVYPFYNQSEDVQPPSPQPTGGKENTNQQYNDMKKPKARTVIFVVVSIVSTSLLVGALYFWFCRTTKLAEYFNTAEDIRTAESLHYDFTMVRAASNNFSEENKLGQGGFGDVYKGKLEGQDLAVKRLSRGHGQGEEEFKTEVLLVAKLQHRNLVRLLGFCLSGEERLLIYEFVPNSSLDRYIFDPVRRRELDWETRLDIIGGIARGLLYLHQDSRLRIIHRDLKASNVLLEADMTPKIADFGTARLTAVDNSDSATSRIVGTYGYMAPEYALYGQFSIKSDVFSFGVLVLEIVCGQRNVRTQHGELVEDLLTSVWKNWSEGTVSHILDPLLIEGPRLEILRCIHIGLLCVQENAANRPNMATVTMMLNSFTISLPVPTQPALYMQSNMDLSLSFSAASNSLYASSADKTPITGLYPR